jgi:hypothetical protein
MNELESFSLVRNISVLHRGGPTTTTRLSFVSLLRLTRSSSARAFSFGAGIQNNLPEERCISCPFSMRRGRPPQRVHVASIDSLAVVICVSHIAVT